MPSCLIAEDEAIISMMLADCLEDAGHQVLGPIDKGSAVLEALAHLNPDMAILDAKMEQLRKAGVDILATGNPGCMFQFRYGARRSGLQIEVVHPVELLARALG